VRLRRARRRARFAVQGDGSDGAFDGVGILFDAAVTEEQDQPIPAFGNVFQGFSSRRFACDAGSVLCEPKLEGIGDGF